jgi:hypothetical protein
VTFGPAAAPPIGRSVSRPLVAIGEGLRSAYEVAVVPVGRAAEVVDGAALLVVGGPTHVHGMTRPRSREAAVEAARKPGSTVVVEDGADGPGIREWLASLGQVDVLAAAFDTRMTGPPAFTGRASKGISRELGRHGGHLVASPESFLVTKENALVAGEETRARDWGARLAAEPRSAPGFSVAGPNGE